MLIRYAISADAKVVRQIAIKQSKWVGFVRSNEIERGIQNRELFVAECNGEVVGFCNWHKRSDTWSTIYALAVLNECQGQGIGQMLLRAVPTPIHLKCMENNPANEFYRNAGMRLVKTESGRVHALNVYEMRVLSIIVRGNKANVPEICRKTGNAYGIQYNTTAHAWPYMIDSDPVACDWSEMMQVVNKWHPVQALTTDYYPGQRDTMLSQVADLRAAGVLRIAVCPKFHGAVADIPDDCIVAVSLKTNGKLAKGANKYAGFMPDFEELRFRRVHLLGGSPRLQKDTLVKLQAIGAKVLSVDGNSQFGAAERGSAWIDGRWQRKNGEAVNLYDTQVLSSRNIQRELQTTAQWQQLALFD